MSRILVGVHNVLVRLSDIFGFLIFICYCKMYYLLNFEIFVVDDFIVLLFLSSILFSISMN